MSHTVRPPRSRAKPLPPPPMLPRRYSSSRTSNRRRSSMPSRYYALPTIPESVRSARTPPPLPPRREAPPPPAREVAPGSILRHQQYSTYTPTIIPSPIVSSPNIPAHIPASTARPTPLKPLPLHKSPLLPLFTLRSLLHLFFLISLGVAYTTRRLSYTPIVSIKTGQFTTTKVGKVAFGDGVLMPLLRWRGVCLVGLVVVGVCFLGDCGSFVGVGVRMGGKGFGMGKQRGREGGYEVVGDDGRKTEKKRKVWRWLGRGWIFFNIAVLAMWGIVLVAVLWDIDLKAFPGSGILVGMVVFMILVSVGMLWYSCWFYFRFDAKDGSGEEMDSEKSRFSGSSMETADGNEWLQEANFTVAPRMSTTPLARWG
ncbi:hypothetical protein K402DRAFT_265846 [Aulographum hederae CBS 113979]|uniref:Uncharacterized protein n=1 Tax=Aulographum hederae CBS 113979 TaxID=1176131 RepID=A0A6G1GIP3_9PEZI|nr:hypothetical protein K402DRAFT_265846 [Aulographum hederae CBS 113979]